MKKILLGIFILLLMTSVGHGQEQPVKVTIEAVNAITEERGVYVLHADIPFQFKVTLENTSDRELNLLTPDMQNHYLKVFYFQILDNSDNVIATDTREVIMEHNETIGPTRIKLPPKQAHSFYAYLNSNKYGIEHHHFLDFKVLKQKLQDRYYQIRGVYDTTGVDWYREIVDYVKAYSNPIKVELVKPQPIQLTIKSDKKIYKMGESIIIQIELKNNSSEAITGLYDLTQTDSKGEITHNVPDSEIGIWGKRFSKLILESGEAVVEEVNITGGFDKKPGIYKYTAFVQIEEVKERERKNSLTSNAITIEVVEKKQPLQLTIKSDKQVYELGEEIIINANFHNKSAKSMTIAIGKQHISDLEVYQEEKQLIMGILYDIKEAPLGFLNDDYYVLQPREVKEVMLHAKVEKFSNKKLLGPALDYTGFAIVSENIAFLSKTSGSFQLRLKYKPKFPSSKDEEIHSAYHRQKNVWTGTLTSNTITIKAVEKK